MSVVFFDLETDSTISNSHGVNRTEQIKNLQFTVCSLLTISIEAIKRGDSVDVLIESGKMKSYWRDSQNDIEAMISAFDDAEVVVGYNIFGFDWPVLRRFFADKRRYHCNLYKSLDVFSRVRDVAGFWPKLDTLLKRNKIEAKTADGLQAIAWFAEGRLEELKSYCESDVRAVARLSLSHELLVDSPGVGEIVVPSSVYSVQSFLKSKAQ